MAVGLSTRPDYDPRFLTRRRAWQFLGSGEAIATARKTEWKQSSCFPCRGANLAQFWLLRRRQKAWLRFTTVRRDLSQADASTWL